MGIEFKKGDKVIVEVCKKPGPWPGDYFVDAVDEKAGKIRIVSFQAPDQFGWWVDPKTVKRA